MMNSLENALPIYIIGDSHVLPYNINPAIKYKIQAA